MKTSISKKAFIDQFEISIRTMAHFVESGNMKVFFVCQSDFSSLLGFAYVNDLLSLDEYDRYRKYAACSFSDFPEI